MENTAIYMKNESFDEEVWNAPKILVVDDEVLVRRTVLRALKMKDYECVQAASSDEARRILRDMDFDLILCDLKMPGESGMDFITYVLKEYPETAVIMLTGVDDPVIAESVLETGAYGYIIKPFKPTELIINVSNALRRRKLEIENKAYGENLEAKVVERTEAFKSAMDGIIHALATTSETRDPYTAGHQMRVASLASAIGKEMGLSHELIEGIHMSGMIHDIGKIAIPAEILTKPSRLTDIEFSLIKTHPGAGYEILKNIKFPWPIADVTFQHHERLDGSGYPQGLSGEDILIESSIIAVADVVEAMASHRPYRPALGIEKALDEIAGNRGSLYDPEAVDACLRLFKKNRFAFSQDSTKAA